MPRKGESRNRKPESQVLELAPGTYQGREIDPRNLQPIERATVRRQATNLITNRALEAINGAIDQAKRGNCQMLKFLLEVIGLFADNAPEEPPNNDTVPKMILGCLKLPENEIAKIRSNGHAQADAVK